MRHDNLDDSKSDFIQYVQTHKQWFGNVEVSLIVVRQDGKNYLFDGNAVFLHKNDTPRNEILYDYGHVVLIRKIFEIDDFLNFFQESHENTLNVKDLMSVFVGLSFTNSVYNVPSHTDHVGVFDSWPFRVYHCGGDSNMYVHSSSDFLVKSNCPSFSNLHDAVNYFLKNEYQIHDSRIKGLQLIVPNYSARIKTIEISNKNIDVEIETREIDGEQLILQINARRDKEYSHPGDLMIKEGKLSVKFVFEPKEFNLFLVNSITEEIIDYVEYGDYMTSRHKGISIKTSSELIEELISKGENRHLELKQTMSDEFLESIAAFANTDGGKVILGVNDRQIVVGIHDEYSNLEKRIRGTILSNIHPQIEVDVELVEIQQKPLVVVTVLSGTNKPYVQSGKLYIRNNENDVPMERSELDTIYGSKHSSEQVFYRTR